MPDVKAEQFLRRLFAKTMAGEITWAQTSDTGVFITNVGSYIMLFRCDGPSAEQLYVIKLLDSEGAILDSYNDEMFDEAGKAHEPGSMYHTMLNAYSIARRQAMGIDHALDEILDELGDGEPPE